MVPKTAIIGATGFIGKAFYAAHHRIHPDCVGTTRDMRRKYLRYLDLSSPVLEPLELAQSGHREALILAGMANPALCEKDKGLARKVNVDGTLELIEKLVAEGIKPVFFSSDVVFDGMTGEYAEDSPVNPLNEYGRQKVEVEAGSKKICSGGNYLVVRIPKTFSLNKGDGSLFDEMAAVFRRGGTVRAASDQIFSPIFVLDLVRAVMVLQTRGATGVIHISPAEIWSRYDLALALARCMGVDSGLVEKIALADLGENFRRPKNTTMRTDRLIRETGYEFPPMMRYIEKVAENWRTETDETIESIKLNRLLR